ncbi:mevalonate kinase-like isoform X2 [Coccinella septempunctata]|uniref:mevalonate kinase-like isoform X2 n=1 Tax=Coccinella septempunctata TaxID=41139 RepID=UPI001D05F30F|nr:mevalonate kinase-like isoform X2 [Coccinella septempunctata]
MSSAIDSQFSNVSPSGDFINKSNGIVFTISAPGKVILHGEHSVVYGKLALAASLGLRTSGTLRELENTDDASVIEVHFPDINLHYSFDFKEIQNLLDKPLPVNPDISHFNLEHPERLDHDLHLKNVEGFLSGTEGYHNLSKLKKNSLVSFLYLFTAMFTSLNVSIRPFHFSVSSHLSIGAGTGSSASFVVCLVASFLHYVKLLSKRGNVGGNLSKYGYGPTLLTFESYTARLTEDLLKITSDWSFYGERIHHGNPSGIDNTICTYGSLLVFKKGCPPERKTMDYPLKLLLINTKVSRDTKTLVGKVADFVQRFPEVGNGLLCTMDEVSKNALDCIECLNKADSSCEETAGAFEKLEELSDINHSLLRILGVSHPTLEEIVTILRGHGLRGKLTGAGGGGYATCLVPPSCSQGDLDAVLTDLSNAGFDVKMTSLGDAGVRVDS